jgi:hypothetical protein
MLVIYTTYEHLAMAFPVGITDDLVYSVTRSTTQNSLSKSFILDSGATAHAYNDKSRFKTLTPYEGSEDLLAGEARISIEATGTVQIMIECPSLPGGKRTLFLKNTIYAPRFYTSVCSLRKFVANNIHWDTENKRLQYKGRTVCLTPFYHNQWVMDYNPIQESEIDALPWALAAHKSEAPRPPVEGIAHEWHLSTGHLYPEAVKHPEKQTTRAILIDQAFEEACVTCNAKAHISRKTPDPPSRAYERVHWDAIEMPISNDYFVFVSHFLEELHGIHHVCILSHKDADSVIRNFSDLGEFVHTQWGYVIMAFKHDGDRALMNKYKGWTSKRRGRIEETPQYAHDVNGKIERFGGGTIIPCRKTTDWCQLTREAMARNLPYGNILAQQISHSSTRLEDTLRTT